jgi:hypothetical protein
MRLMMSLSAAALLAGCATSDVESSDEASIPFVRSNGIAEWKKASRDSLHVRSITGDWYLIRTMGRCSALGQTFTLGFETSLHGELDRHGTIVAEGQRCPIASVTRSGAPPRKSAGRGA